MNRITVNMLEEAYLKNGFGVCFNSYNKKNSGCALTHLYAATNNVANPKSLTMNKIVLWAMDNYEYNYLLGFLAGFDDYNENKISINSINVSNKAQFAIGSTDGKLCRTWALGQEKNNKKEEKCLVSL